MSYLSDPDRMHQSIVLGQVCCLYILPLATMRTAHAKCFAQAVDEILIWHPRNHARMAYCVTTRQDHGHSVLKIVRCPADSTLQGFGHGVNT